MPSSQATRRVVCWLSTFPSSASWKINVYDKDNTATTNNMDNDYCSITKKRWFQCERNINYTSAFACLDGVRSQNG